MSHFLNDDGYFLVPLGGHLYHGFLKLSLVLSKHLLFHLRDGAIPLTVSLSSLNLGYRIPLISDLFKLVFVLSSNFFLFTQVLLIGFINLLNVLLTLLFALLLEFSELLIKVCAQLGFLNFGGLADLLKLFFLPGEGLLPLFLD